MKKRLIDADALKATISNYEFNSPNEKYKQGGQCVLDYFMPRIIDDAPTVDAVEVVRCKDCVHFESICHGCGYCYHWDYEPGSSPNTVDDDDFCSYGERRIHDEP